MLVKSIPSKIKPGFKAKITGVRSAVEASKGLRQRLLSMGLTPGTIFEVVRLAPLGDPVQIKVRGFLLGLRRFELEPLQLEVL